MTSTERLALDRLTAIAAAALRAPVAQVNTVDSEGQTSLSTTGPAPWDRPRTVSLEASFCRHVVESGEPLVIEDARIHPVVRDSPSTTEVGVLAYVAVPLTVAGGAAVGTLCVFDFEPRAWTGEDVRLLEHLGAFAVQEITRRREAEAENRMRDARFGSLIRHAPDLIVIVDAAGSIDFQSPSFERLLGHSPGQISDAFKLVHPDDRPAVLDAFAEVIDQPVRTVEMRYRYRHGNGAWRVLESTATNLLDDPAVRGVVVNSRDVTEWVRTQEALRESEARYRLMVEGSAGIFFFTHDRSGRFEYLSPSVAQVLGYAPDELRGQHYATLLTGEPEDAEVHANTERTLRGEETTSTYISRTRHRDGRTITLELTESALVDEGGVVGVHGFARDVSDRARAQEELVRSRDFYLSVLEHFPALIWRSDPEGRCDYVNRTWLDFTGRIFDEEVGADWAGDVHPEDRDRCVGDFQAALRERRPYETEYRLRHRDGEYRWIRDLGRPLYGPGGAFVGFIGAGFETHEQRRLEQQLRVAQRMEGLGRLAGGIAHDFNNILGVIGGTAELLLLDLPGEGPVRDDVEEIKRAADRAADLTRQLLAFGSHHALRPESVDVNEVITGMEKLLRRTLGADVEFVTVLDEALDPVEADPTQIGQMLMNLAVNARDAMPEGGKLVTETRNVEIDGEAAGAGAIPSGSYVRIRVGDTGHGMSPEVQERVFDPFYTTKAAGQGTGLGLATVYGIVQQSGGFIGVQSEVGRGTTFDIHLPRATASETAPEGVVEGRAQHVRGSGTILLAEDQSALRAVARRALERVGYRVLEAANGEEALRVARAEEGPIDLLLTDVVMPLMSGTDLAEKIVAERPGTRVLLMSGYAAEGMLENASGAGRDLIHKPFSPSDLLARVGEVLQSAPAEPS